MRITTLLATVIVFANVAAEAAAPGGDFEVPADEAPAASLAPAQVSGANFSVRDPVHSDGLMHRYVVTSPFGDFAAYGRDELDLRLREVAALTQISETSESEVALKAVTRGIKQDVKSVVMIAANPVGTIVGIPRGIAHLLGGLGSRAKEATSREQKSSGSEEGAAGEPVGKRPKNSAGDYIDRYMGLSAAERRWYQKLEVDPYTRNEVLRGAVRRLAKIDSKVSFGLKFVPGLPYAGHARRALDAVYGKDPRTLRKERREALAGFGLTPAEVERFENTLLLDPTRQTALVDAMRALEGVSAREELLRTAMAVTSEEEVQVFLRSTELLLRAHADRPVARIVPGLRLPTAQFADRRIAVFGAFDAVQWTADVAGYESAMREALPTDVAAREVWLSGAVSPRARDALVQRGWEVHDRAATAPVAQQAALQ